MIRRIGLLILFSLSIIMTPAAFARSHGEIRDLEFGGVAVWDAAKEDWVTPIAFWRSFMRRTDGRSWGTRTTYPTDAESREFDTLLIELESGLCLMEYSGSRWRPANEVHGWDPGFDEVRGCPDVSSSIAPVRKILPPRGN